MEKQSFIIAIDILAVIYLMWKTYSGVVISWQAVRNWWHRRSFAGRLRLADDPHKAILNGSLSISLLVLVLGCGVVIVVYWRFPNPDWYLPALVIASFSLEVLRQSHKQLVLPDVINLLVIYRAASTQGYEQFDALKLATRHLSSGLLKDAVDEVLLRQRRGLPPEKCLAPLKKHSKYLAEFVKHLVIACWRSKASPDVTLAVLVRQAERDWDFNRQTLLFINKIQAYVRLLQIGITGGLLAALWFSSPHFLGLRSVNLNIPSILEVPRMLAVALAGK